MRIRIKLNLTTWIFIGMLLGIIGGLIVHSMTTPDIQKTWVHNVSIGSDIFLHLIKMVIAPLVFCLLATGIAKIGDLKSIGRVGGKAMLWFVLAALLSLSIGLILMNIFNIGSYMTPPDYNASGMPNGEQSAINMRDFILHIFPKSIINAMADNEILQVVVFALFFGVAAAALADKAKKVVEVFAQAGHILLQIMSYVMYFSPFASFAALFSVVAVQGGQVLKSYLFLVLVVFGGLALIWIILTSVGYLFLGKQVFRLLKECKVPFIIAFSTTSSESAYPLVIKKLKQFGCSEKIINFVLPLGYSFNLDGSMMYTSIASLFIAQVYQIDLSITTQLTMLFFLMITSKGIAGVPRASFVIIAGALTAFNIPEAGLALLLGIDAILDMGRSATNIMGNTIATAVISKVENQLVIPEQEK